MKPIIFLLPIILFAIGCVSQPAVLTVAANDTVSVDYTGMLQNGTVFDSSVGRQPLTFVAGAGEMISGFDKAVIGMRVGDEKNVTISPGEGYGEWDPSRVIVVNRSLVPNETKIGDTLYSANNAVTVINMTANNVTIDTNFFLAGKTLVFDIKVLNITKAK